MSFRVPEQYRLRRTVYATTTGERHGVFIVPFGRRVLKVLASDGCSEPGASDLTEGWEHVSVSLADRGGATMPTLPTWQEMCHIKALFWDDEDCVVQYHPAAADYVDLHPVLHLWRHPTLSFPMPPKVCV